MTSQPVTSHPAIQEFHTVPTILADVAIMDYFIHQSIVYRLHFLRPEIDGEDRRCGLEMAFSYALNADQMNRLMLELLRVCNFSEEQLPIDAKSRVRRIFGKVIGNAFFFSDTDCRHFEEAYLPIGACCLEHEMEGWKRVINDIASLPFPDGEEDAFMEQQIALRIAIMIYSNVKFGEWTPLVNQIFASDDGTPSQMDHHEFLTQIPGSHVPLRTAFESRIRELRQMFLNCTDKKHVSELVTTLKQTYNVDKIRSNLLDWIRLCYQCADLELPSVLIAIKGSFEQDSKTASQSRSSPQRKIPHLTKELSSPIRGQVQMKENRQPSPLHSKFIPTEHLRKIGDNLLKEIERGENEEANDWLQSIKHSRKHSPIHDHHGSAERIQWSDEESNAAQQLQGLSTPRNVTRTDNKTSSEADYKDHSTARRRRRFTEDEIVRLIAGVKRFGRDWVKIRQHYNFDGRTNVDLKDKARNLARIGRLVL